MFFGFQSRYRLCELFGIPLYLDFSLVILLFLFATGGGSLFSGLLCAAMLLFSITAHELGHALTARAFGFQTRDITLSLLGGCASLIALPRKASQEFLTAVAGPAVSFALSGLGAAAIAAAAEDASLADSLGFVLRETLGSFGIPVSSGEGFYVRPDNLRFVSSMLYLSVMNAMLGFFNLLPGFPLDGGRVFRSAMSRFMPRVRATFVAMAVGRAVSVAIGLKGLWNLLNGGNWGFVTIMIAWMIWKEGMREYEMAKAEEWRGGGFYNARVSPPPYGGESETAEIERESGRW